MTKKKYKKSSPPAVRAIEAEYVENVPRTLSAIRQNTDLRCRIQVLLHDLCSISSDTSVQKRISSTRNQSYTSEPYFIDIEATAIRTAVIDTVIEPEGDAGLLSGLTIESAIQNSFANFFDKRKASGDARPCGPHDMLPIYGNVFGIDRAELKDERFVSRVRRSGLGNAQKVGLEDDSKLKAGLVTGVPNQGMV